MNDIRQARHHRHTRSFFRRFTLAGLLAMVFLGGLGVAPVAGQERSDWKSGPAFRQQLDASISVAWEDRPLREALSSLSRSTQVAVLLDRRIDPEQTIQMDVADQSLNLLFRQLAAELDAGVGAVGSVVYLGPRATAGKLSSLAALRRKEATALPAVARAKLLQSRAWQWDEATAPRELLDGLAQQAGITIANAEVIPHDLWPAGDWPALLWTERLTLLLAGFDLTFAIDSTGQTIHLTAIPESAVVEKSYTPRGNPADVVAQLTKILPEAKVRFEGGKLWVVAAEEDQAKVAQLLSGKTVRTAQVQPAEKRYSLTVENQPAGAIVSTVAKQLGKQLQAEPAIRERLQQQVSLSVKDVTLEELMKKSLGPLGLTYKLGEQTLEIVEN